VAGGAGRQHPRHRLRARHQAVEERGVTFRRIVVRIRQADPHREQAFGGEAQRHLHQAVQRAQQQSRPHQQHQRQRHLGHHQPVAQARAGHPAGGAPAVPHGVDQVQPPGLQGRRQPRQHPRQRRNQHRVAQHPVIQAQVPRIQRRRHQARQQSHAPPRDQDAQQAAAQRQHQAFRQQLPQHVPARGPQRRPYGHLLTAIGGPRQQQVGHVHAGDQQHQRNCRQQNHQRRPQRPREPLTEPGHARTDSGVGRGIRARQAAGDGVHLDLRLRQRRPRLEPRDHIQVVVVLAPVEVHPQHRVADRDEHFTAAIAAESRRQYSHHGVRPPVQPDDLADDARIPHEVGLPHGV